MKTYIVKVAFKAARAFEVLANNKEEAHKQVYNTFMDTPINKIFVGAYLDDVEIETTIDGEDGGDFIHY